MVSWILVGCNAIKGMLDPCRIQWPHVYPGSLWDAMVSCVAGILVGYNDTSRIPDPFRMQLYPVSL